MKLGLKLPLGLAVLILGMAGLIYWLLGVPLQDAGAKLEEMKARLTVLQDKETEFNAVLANTKAEKAAVEVALRASRALDTFVRGSEGNLSDLPQMATAKAGDMDGTVAELFKRGGNVIDRVIAYNYRGAVVSVAPMNDALIGKQDPDAAKDARLFLRPRSPLIEVRMGPGQPAALVASMGLMDGSPPRLKFFFRQVASFDSLLRASLENPPDKMDVRLFAADDDNNVVFAPTPDMLGKSLKDGVPELAQLASAPEGKAIEIRYGGQEKWMAVKQKVSKGITVVGLAKIVEPEAVVAEATQYSAPAKVPLPLIIGAVAVALAMAVGLVLLPMQRLKSLTDTVAALSQGATSVEMKGLSSRDEIGEMARAASRFSDLLTEERRRREEAEGTVQQTQRDLKRSQDEARELTEYQKDLETRTRREKEALDGELQSAHSEAENQRAEVERVRTELKVKEDGLKAWEAAVAERDRMIGQVNLQMTDMQGQIAQLQQQVNGLNAALAAAQKELETRPKGPASAFSLFAEATDALSIEVGNLLELIQGFTAQMMESGEISEEQQSFVMGVTQRAARSQRLLADMRDYSVISRPDGMVKEPVDLVLLISDVVGTIQQAAEEKGLEFVADLPPSMPELIGDEGRLRQLFTVLLQNAVRFTPEGGRVSVSVGLKGEMAGIRIEDTAEPIPATAEEVLGHFHTVDEEIMELRGSGLRYPILRTIAEIHAGSIDLAINEQGGNLFFIRLPVRAFAPTAEETATLFASVPEPAAGISEAAAAASGPAVAASPAAAGVDLMDAALAFATGAAAPQAAAPAAPAPAGPDLLDAALAFATSGGVTPVAGAEPASPFNFDAAPAAPEPAATEPAAGGADLLDAALAFATSGAPGPEAGGLPDATASLDSIMSAAPEAAAPEAAVSGPDSGAAIPDLWQVPGEGEAPTLDALEAAPSDGSPAGPASPQGPAAGSKGEPPPDSFTFGSDEIVQE